MSRNKVSYFEEKMKNYKIIQKQTNNIKNKPTNYAQWTSYPISKKRKNNCIVVVCTTVYIHTIDYITYIYKLNENKQIERIYVSSNLMNEMVLKLLIERS